MFSFKRGNSLIGDNSKISEYVVHSSILILSIRILVHTVFLLIVSAETFFFWKWKVLKFSYSFRIMVIFYTINWIVAEETIQGVILFKRGNYSRKYGILYCRNQKTSWNHNIFFVSLSVSFCIFPFSKGHFFRAYLDAI